MKGTAEAAGLIHSSAESPLGAGLWTPAPSVQRPGNAGTAARSCLALHSHIVILLQPLRLPGEEKAFSLLLAFN